MITKLLNFHALLHRINRKLVAEDHKLRTVNNRQGKHWELINTLTGSVVQVWTRRIEVQELAHRLGVVKETERVLMFIEGTEVHI